MKIRKHFTAVAAATGMLTAAATAPAAIAEDNDVQPGLIENQDESPVTDAPTDTDDNGDGLQPGLIETETEEAPVEPAEPETPVEPVEPEVPVVPVEPVEDTTPVFDEVSFPSEPVVDDRAEAPVVPDSPAEPAETNAADTPAQTGQPMVNVADESKPSVPAQAEAPADQTESNDEPVLFKAAGEVDNPNWRVAGDVVTIPYETTISTSINLGGTTDKRSLTFGAYEDGAIDYSINGGKTKTLTFDPLTAGAIEWWEKMDLVPPAFEDGSYSKQLGDTEINAKWTGTK